MKNIYNPLQKHFPNEKINGGKNQSYTTTNTLLDYDIKNINIINVYEKLNIQKKKKRKINPLKIDIGNIFSKKNSMKELISHKKESEMNYDENFKEKLRYNSVKKNDNIFQISRNSSNFFKYNSKQQKNSRKSDYFTNDLMNKEKNKDIRKSQLKNMIHEQDIFTKKKSILLKNLNNLKKKDSRDNFLNSFGKNNGDFYLKENDYSAQVLPKTNDTKEMNADSITKKPKNKLNFFFNFKTFACNCEMIRMESQKCIRITKLLETLQSPPEGFLLKTYQEKLNSIYIPPEKLVQIHKDIKRTYSNKHYFKPKNEGFKKLERLLVSISDYKDIGYVQGMNFIAASFLWHCEEEFSYYLILKFFEVIKVKTYYTDNLNGVVEKSKDFWEILRKKHKNIVDNIEHKGILPEMILPEWFITFGCNIIPLELHIFVFEGILFEGWSYFFTLLENVFLNLYPLFRYKDFSDSLLILKLNQIVINWDKIIC